MNDTQVKIMKDTAEFLYEAGLSRNFLRKFLLQSFEAKTWVNNILGISEENDYRVNIPCDAGVADEFKEFLNTLCSIKERETGTIWEVADAKTLKNKGNSFKITRLLTREVYQKLIKRESFRSILEKTNIFECCCADCLDNEESIDKLVSRFGVWYGDQAKGEERVIVISSNPLDILRASTNTSFSSCYRVDGEYFNGTITNALSPNTVVASVESLKAPGYKIGRSWVYFSDQLIIVGRKYGGIYDQHTKSIADHIERRVGGSDWVGKQQSRIKDMIRTNGPGYLDSEYGEVYARKSWDRSSIVLPQAMCLYCGTYHKGFGSRGVCVECGRLKPEMWKE